MEGVSGAPLSKSGVLTKNADTPPTPVILVILQAGMQLFPYSPKLG